MPSMSSSSDPLSVESIANQFVCDLVAYEPGKPIEETARELGLDPDSIVKLASNENSLGPSKKAQEAMQNELNQVHIYPDGVGHKLRSALADRYDLGLENVVIGNGSNEIIELLCHSFLNPQAELIAAEHAFVVYKLMATLFGAKYVEVPDPNFIHDLDGMLAAITEDTRLVFIANPNNPTGTFVDGEALDRFIEAVPDHVVVVFDEAYFEFWHDAPDTLKYIREGRNVVVLRTFSKAYGLAGLRVGYGLCAPGVAAILQKARQPFNVNAMAQTAALAALNDAEHVQATLAMNDAGLKFYSDAFDARGLEYVPSVANFILVKVGDGNAVFQAMLQKGVIVRAMGGYKLPEWIRISVGTEVENKRCLEVLDEVLAANR